jgi:hypothetical protein
VFAKATMRAIAAAQTTELDHRQRTFPGTNPHARTYAAWPVWSDSTRAEERFQPMPRRQSATWSFPWGPAC